MAASGLFTGKEKMKKYNFEEEAYLRAYCENIDRTVIERIGLAMRENAKYRPVEFWDKCLLPMISDCREEDSAWSTFSDPFDFDAEKFEKNAGRHPEHKKEYDEMYSLAEPNIPYNVRCGEISDREMRMMETHLCWGGTWSGHGNPDYYRLLHLGTEGIRKIISENRIKNKGKDAFYDGCTYALDALDIMGERIYALACDMAKKETDPERKKELERIKEVYSIIPVKPAYDIFSATQFMWMYFSFEGGYDSPGRYDEFMLDYWRVSSDEDNEKCLYDFLEAMQYARGWNVCISGSDENWNDETNEITYAMLRAVKKLGYNTPNLTLRVNRNTPDDLWHLAAECIGTGIGLPAIYNDEVVCPALEKCGIPPRDSHDYCMNGCNQIDIMGKSHMGLEDGEVNLAKVLELTLHRGFSMWGENAPERLTPDLGDPEECVSFDEFLQLYYKNLRHTADIAVSLSNRCQKVNSEFGPSPLRSCLIQGCLEKGKEYFAGGALYNDGQILAEGIADAGDSLYAVKKLIFDEEKYTMRELIAALKDNFEGHEKLRRDFKNCEKFGNDIEEVDNVTAGIVNYFFAYLKTKRTFRGGIFTGGCSPFSRAADNGMTTAALPNGKKNGESTFADSIAATPGNDRNGPTASAKSMLHYNQYEACSGFIAQFKFDKAIFNTEDGLNAFITLCKTYFREGGQHVSVNVVDREELLDAKKNPEKHKNLIVRVGGYSAYFWTLPPELQQNVIDRTTF